MEGSFFWRRGESDFPASPARVGFLHVSRRAFEKKKHLGSHFRVEVGKGRLTIRITGLGMLLTECAWAPRWAASMRGPARFSSFHSTVAKLKNPVLQRNAGIRIRRESGRWPGG
ncbi:MAG TPA: hypothetical protein VEA17_09485, partial [Bordetella sp.]|nr:hypothetical protein [Bordetella sp.]